MEFYFIKCLSDGFFYVGTNFRLDDDDNISIRHAFSYHSTNAFLFASKADAERHASEIGLYFEIPGGIEIVSI